MTWFYLSGRVLLGGVFLLAAASKTRRHAAYAEFRAAVARLARVPAAAVPGVAALVVAVEFALAAGVIASPTAIPALFAAAGVLAVFTVVLDRGRRRDPGVRCACFGGSSGVIGPARIVRNAVLIALALAGAVLGLAAGDPPGSAVGGWVVAAFAGSVGAVLIARADDLAAVFTPTRRAAALPAPNRSEHS